MWVPVLGADGWVHLHLPVLVDVNIAKTSEPWYRLGDSEYPEQLNLETVEINIARARRGTFPFIGV